jgi:hypothetical protein
MALNKDKCCNKEVGKTSVFVNQPNSEYDNRLQKVLLEYLKYATHNEKSDTMYISSKSTIKIFQ